MKILIIGGHLSPALSVIENLKEIEVFYVGRKYSMEGDSALSLEYRTMNKLNIPFFELTTGRLQRAFTKHTLASIAKIPIGLLQAFVILKKTKPDVVLGFGGYVCVPIILAAYMLKIPSVLHEQTLEAGLANKILALFVKKICISFPSSQNFFPKNKTVLTGLPLKREVLDVKTKEREENKVPILYITGGSQGSHAINSLVMESLGKLLETFRIVHQTGDFQEFNDFEKLVSLKKILPKGLGIRYLVKKFLDPKEAAEIMQSADIVVSRSGINSVCELIFLEKPSLLIPLSFSQRNEQLKNAKYIESLGLARVYEQNSLTSQTFVSALKDMLKNIKQLRLTGQNPLETKASLKIIEVLKDVVSQKKS
ncbi:MAG: UDP-N-acetylglucosamine--N-acetylmuramyl-(pentapeptide) pyrophosphoryl-undecaprenol N-acetylglucosamine transferase [Candidatus Levybacteria bacterium]|nr:UDP-N-acetylglucosamine--N-acetylmuramyl-(pentapeptide) pyrophosphoryl-undecaprenol N-acetylglucosamine transferase [Candidatus Levybacteria bacterium]